jgi:DNA helicase-2/ATP-dependent DNA helicase PcrA
MKPEAAERLNAVQNGLVELSRRPIREAIPFILDNLWYRKSLKKTCGEGLGMLSAMCVLDGLSSVISGTAGYDDLLRRIARLSELAAHSGGAREGCVTLSTAHSAKGLEFDSVFVTDLVEGRFPAASAITETGEGHAAAMEEERRLFYVAVTRARRQVELITVSSVFGMTVKPSRFIREAMPDRALMKTLERYLKN